MLCCICWLDVWQLSVFYFAGCAKIVPRSQILWAQSEPAAAVLVGIYDPFQRCFCIASEDTRVAIAVVEFFLSSAVKYAVTGDVFSSELQQLGFPKGTFYSVFSLFSGKRQSLLAEHATSLSKVYQADASLAKVFANSGFRSKYC